MSARLFLDTNVIIDLLGNRDPFFEPIAKIVSLADRGRLTIVACPISFATVNYILTKYENAKTAIDKLRKFNVLAEVCNLDETIIEKGLNSNFKDFEDALQYYSALSANCEIIISRKGKDFKHSSLPVLSAKEYLKSLGQSIST
ncbi:MAG: PIN domain-containing protein [Salibacteraceae bacterium]|nr:PIN domain-containing protein [Salibacteraceae bacterium]|tara:strand:- start:1715 stop:2146 length:432 start_codon:yes stop_codon:yes gene_type:complete